MTSVIVIGAGVLGASVAFRMAQDGAAVTLIEAGRLAGGTSTRSFAWLNAHNKVPQPYFALNLAGMRAHAALQAELAEAVGIMPAAASSGRRRPTRCGCSTPGWRGCSGGATPPSGSAATGC